MKRRILSLMTAGSLAFGLAPTLLIAAETISPTTQPIAAAADEEGIFLTVGVPDQVTLKPTTGGEVILSSKTAATIYGVWSGSRFPKVIALGNPTQINPQDPHLLQVIVGNVVLEAKDLASGAGPQIGPASPSFQPFKKRSK